MFHVVFICTGNTCRSPMAAALFNAHAARWGLAAQASSAGVAALPGCPASSEACEAMASRGVSLAGHRARVLTLAMLAQADLVLTMTAAHRAAVLQVAPEAQRKVCALMQYAGRTGEIADPFGGDARVYELCARQLEVAVGAAVEKIAAQLQAEEEG